LANLLLATADPISGILTNISHDEIGNMIGAARQTITKNLDEMRKQGILIIKQKRIQIVDRRALEQLIERSQT
jgi:CRP-like cAMP-binding protein